MTDLFGFQQPGAGFKDIRNTKDKAAREKAELCMVLNDLLRKTPAFLASASVNTVRAWKDAHKDAHKVLNSQRSTRTELSAAIGNMRRFEAQA